MLDPNSIKVSLEYSGNMITFPMNIQSFDLQRGTASETHDIVGYRQVVRSGSRQLDTLPINTTFKQEVIDRLGINQSALDLSNFMREWQISKQYARIVVEGLSVNMLCLPYGDIVVNIEPGQENTVELQGSVIEYVPHSVSIASGITRRQPPERPQERAAPRSKTHTVVSGDTLYGISRRFGRPGSAWRELYAIPANRQVIGNNPNLIFPGQRLIIPENWL